MEDVGAVGDRARVIVMGRATRALVLARGRGSRMAMTDPATTLSADQAAAADAGRKPFMPIGGRLFIDYLLDSLRRAGVHDLALVVGPEENARGGAVRIVQQDARGTADAVLSAESWVGDAPFLVVNGDNLYPVPALSAVAALDGPGLAGFDREDLVKTGNIPADRVAAFAVIERDSTGHLARIIEKPSAAELAALPAPVLVSMNLWKFDARIFDACRDVRPSPRGELELPSAVMLARSRGVSFAVVPAVGPVLDLSRRSDVAEVTRRLGAAAE